MKSVLEYLEHSAELYPDSVAFADESKSITFRELQKAGEAAGSFLCREDVFKRAVPVMMEKSVDAVRILMGIVYAGGFYVMLEPSQPEARLSRILDTLEPACCVVGGEFREKFSGLHFQGKVFGPDELTGSETNREALNRVSAMQCDIDPLYGMFTSGSTGVPKGVVVSHRSVIDFMEYFTDIFRFSHEDVIGNQAPWDFDVSVKDIYAGLKCGAAVQIIPRRMFSIPMQLLDFLDERKVTSLTWAVSALCIVSAMNGLSYKVPASLKRIMFSGEAMPVRHLNYWKSYVKDAMYVNLYGPTEITCNCTYYILDREFEAGEALPIGRAFPNERVFLLDEKDRLVTEKGVQGEICVAGTALALGYYNQDEVTEKAFVPNPLNKAYKEMMYRTGDLGIYNGRGELTFTSRKDFQIKHMGHRIELGEIECALEKVEAVVRGVCFFDKDKNKIVCYYQGAISKKELVGEMARFLPDFMIPNVFRALDELPVTKNGKIDRRAIEEIYKKSRGKKDFARQK